MHLRIFVAALITLTSLVACGASVSGVVLEKHDARVGVPQTFGCTSIEWLLIIDQGERIKSRERIQKRCVTYTTATKYKIGSKYP